MTVRAERLLVALEARFCAALLHDVRVVRAPRLLLDRALVVAVVAEELVVAVGA